MPSRFFRRAKGAESKGAAPARILFDHIPKTGGMSLHAVLEALVGVDQCSPILAGSVDEACAEFARYRCVTSHLYFHPRADLPDVWLFTVLRDPVERALSNLAYLRYDVPASGSAEGQRARNLDLAAELDSADPQTLQLVSNTMVAHFAPLAWNGSDPLDDGKSLALAKEALRRFSLVGLTERMDETIDLLCHALGAQAPVTMPRLNVSSRRIEARALPTAAYERLRRLNALDAELYAFARELHSDARRRALFGPSRAVSIVDAAKVGFGRPRAEVSAAANDAQVAGRRDFGNHAAEVNRIEISGVGGLGPNVLAGEDIIVRVAFTAHQALDDLTVGFTIHDERGRLVYATNTNRYGHRLAIDAATGGAVTFNFRATLGEGHYIVGASLHPGHGHLPICYHWADAKAFFDVVGNMGWNFEGATKLYPLLDFEGVTRHPAADGDAPANLQFLARLAPPLTDFRARITAPQALAELLPGQRVVLRIDVDNLGTERWPSLGERSVRVSYHWLDDGGEVVVQDGERTHLPNDVPPGNYVAMWATVNAPARAGKYRLQLSLVQENVAWLEDLGGEMLEMPVTIRDVTGTGTGTR
jgi:hypothetical protein